MSLYGPPISLDDLRVKDLIQLVFHHVLHLKLIKRSTSVRVKHLAKDVEGGCRLEFVVEN